MRTHRGDALTKERDRDHLLDRIYCNGHGGWCVDKGTILKRKHMNDLYRQVLRYIGVEEAIVSRMSMHGLKAIVPMLAAADRKNCRLATT